MAVQVSKICSSALAMMISGEADNTLGSSMAKSGTASSEKS